jgi:hypothetical protein
MPTGFLEIPFPRFHLRRVSRISAWLREVADYAERSPESGQPGILEFTEPNLRFAVAGHQPGEAVLQVALDLEFQPPWHRRRAAGDPFCMVMHLTARQLRSAARQWDEEIARYPDGMPY